MKPIHQNYPRPQYHKNRQGPFAGFHELPYVKHSNTTCRDSIPVRITLKTAPGPRYAAAIRRALERLKHLLEGPDAIKRRYGIDKNTIMPIEKNITILEALPERVPMSAWTRKLLINSRPGLTTAQLIDLGQSVGMDVPYYFIGNTAFDTEATGIFEELPTSLRLEFVLVVPDFGVSTKEAYKNIDYHRIAKNADKTGAMKKAFLKNRREEVIGNVHNDFELSVFKSNPRLQSIKEKLLATGCKAAVMSGSGSTMIGVLDAESEKETIQKQIGYTTLFVSSKK